MLCIETAQESNSWHLKLSGELDISTVEEFRSSVENIPSAITEVFLDLSALEFVDSTGVGSMVQAVEFLEAQDYLVRFIDVPQEIYEVLDILGIPELLGEELFERLG